jgi:hypothetical protein
MEQLNHCLSVYFDVEFVTLKPVSPVAGGISVNKQVEHVTC